MEFLEPMPGKRKRCTHMEPKFLESYSCKQALVRYDVSFSAIYHYDAAITNFNFTQLFILCCISLYMEKTNIALIRKRSLMQFIINYKPIPYL